MGVTKDQFYDPEKFALLPMGFCFPGSGKSGDLPPLPECAPAWREQLLAQLPNLEITLVIGHYDQAYHLGNAKVTVSQLVRSWKDYWPKVLPLPHPSPGHNIWLRKNPWFETEVLSPLKQRVAEILG